MFGFGKTRVKYSRACHNMFYITKENEKKFYKDMDMISYYSNIDGMLERLVENNDFEQLEPYLTFAGGIRDLDELEGLIEIYVPKHSKYVIWDSLEHKFVNIADFKESLIESAKRSY